MNKKRNLVLLTLFIAGLFGLFSVNTSTQNKLSNTTEQSTKTCTGKKFVMPVSIAAGNDAFEDFLKIAILPAKKRSSSFSKLSNEQKASFIKVNLALQFVKRPAMTKEQQEFVLDAISMVSADMYDLVEPMQTPKTEEVALIQRYEDLLNFGMTKRMVIAKEMPAADRVNIWKTQLAYHLATGRFSKAQNEFILEMLTSLSPETFAPRLGLTKEEEADFAAKSLSPIFSIFTKDEGFALFMTVGIHKYIKDAPVDAPGLEESKWCQCLVSCSAENETCGDENGCMSTPDGCGPWGILGCHYMCVRTPILD